MIDDVGGPETLIQPETLMERETVSLALSKGQKYPFEQLRL